MRALTRNTLLTLSLLTLGSSALADEAGVKRALLKKFPHLSAATVVRAMPIKGLYEVNLQGKISYTNETLDFLLVGGSLIDPATLEDLTAKNQARFLEDLFKSLPLEYAIKSVYGKGERQLVTFENPDCPYCRKQTETFGANAAAINATVYTFIVPLQSFPDSPRKAAFIYCSPEPAKVWQKWMRWDGVSEPAIPLAKEQGKIKIEDGKPVLAPEAKIDCAAAQNVAKSYEVFKGLGYESTPRHIFSNGWAAKGELSAAELEQGFDLAKSSSNTAAPATPPASSPAAPGKSAQAKGKK